MKALISASLSLGLVAAASHAQPHNQTATTVVATEAARMKSAEDYAKSDCAAPGPYKAACADADVTTPTKRLACELNYKKQCEAAAKKAWLAQHP